MSNNTIYVTEPATHGKVVLHTSAGPFDVELWSKEAPKAVRNFVQLGLEGYYDGCIFHRVIREFMAQTGDPSGTGKGGESIYGETFKDEFHGRLRFTHRGLLAMASNGPDTNGSQFFLTLDACEWLDRKHTIFGKVTGNSLYNLPRFSELEVDDKDRPTYPPRIERFEVLLEPFDDIGMSELEKRRARFLQKKRESAGLSKKQRQDATLAKLQMFKTVLSSKPAASKGDDDDDRSFNHQLRFDKKTTMAETAGHYDSFDPLKHGEDDARALSKIKERERLMLSMKQGDFEDDD